MHMIAYARSDSVRPMLSPCYSCADSHNPPRRGVATLHHACHMLRGNTAPQRPQQRVPSRHCFGNHKRLPSLRVLRTHCSSLSQETCPLSHIHVGTPEPRHSTVHSTEVPLVLQTLTQHCAFATTGTSHKLLASTQYN